MGSRIQRRLLGAFAVVAVAGLVPSLLLSEPLGGPSLGALLFGGALALALGALFAALVGRSLAHPVDKLTRAAREMAAGQLDAALPAPGDDELGDLVRALALLRRQLAARIEVLGGESARLRAIVNGMTEGVALVQDGVVEVANPSFGALLGASAGPVEGRTLLETARLPALAEASARAIATRAPVSCELQAGRRMLQLRALPLVAPAPSRARARTVLVLLDVTEVERLERLRRDLVANASHELRTPVAAIVAAAETLAGGAAEDPAARATFIDILTRHATRLARLTQELLDLARLEAGYRPRVEAMALAPAVAAVEATLRQRIEARALAVTIDVPARLRVRAERAGVEQIVTNLLDNAVKYTPSRGRVRVSACAAGEMVELAVEDSGPGIAPEHLERLFERFFRADDARSRDAGGTGLGLAIVKHLALAHGGDVGVTSERGRGSRFTVRLPAA